MNKECVAVKTLGPGRGAGNAETWQAELGQAGPNWKPCNRGEFLKLKPCRHDFQWVPVLTSQKGAIAILEKSGTAFKADDLPGAVSGGAGCVLRGAEAGGGKNRSGIQGQSPGVVSSLPPSSPRHWQRCNLFDEIKPTPPQRNKSQDEKGCWISRFRQGESSSC